MSGKSPVLVDDREPQAYRTTIGKLMFESNIDVQAAHLETGDYLWLNDNGERVCVERKTIADFLSSINDGRWGKQMSHLKDFDFPIVLLEGNIRYVADGTVDYDRAGRYGKSTPNLDGFENLLLTIQLQGIRVTRCGEGAANVARRLRNLYSYTSREHNSATSRQRRTSPIRANATRPSAAFLTGLPGLGTTAANRLLTRFGDITGVIEAIKSGKAVTVEGIGPTRQKQWKQIIEEKYNG